MKRRNVATSLLLVCVLQVSVLERSARAEGASAEDVKRAAEFFDRGRNAYREGNYVEAAEHSETADGYARSPEAIRGAMLSRKAAGQVDRAATLAILALSRYPEDAALSEEANAIVAEFSPKLGRVEVSCDVACELLLNGRIVHGEPMTSRTVFVEPGTHEVKASWSSTQVKRKQATLLEGETAQISFTQPPLPQEPTPTVTAPQGGTGEVAPAVTSEGGWSPVVFWTGVGLTVAGAGVSTFLGIRAINEPGADTVRDACNPTRTTECDKLYDEGLANQTAANIAIGATAAVGAFTILTGAFFTDWSSADSAPSDATQTGFKGRTVARGRGRLAPLQLQAGDFSVTPTFAVQDGAVIGALGTF